MAIIALQPAIVGCGLLDVAGLFAVIYQLSGAGGCGAGGVAASGSVLAREHSVGYGHFAAQSVALRLINSLFLGAMLLRLQLFALGQSGRLLDGLRIALHKLPTLLLAGVLYTIAISFGGVLLLLPGVMLAVSLSLYGYFVLLQDAGALEALAASRALIRGYWWRMLAGYAMPTIVLLVSLLLLPQLDVLPAGYWLYAVLQNAVLGLFGSYFIVLGWLQYQDLQLRQRGCVSKGRTP